MDGRDYDRARHLCEELITITPSATEPYLLWAECLFHQGEMPAAREKLERIIRFAPFSARAYYWLGRCFFEENAVDDAKRNFKKAIYLDQNCVMAHFFLAETFKLNSQREKAIREYKNTLKLLATSSVGDTIFLGQEGITVAALLEACCGNLQRMRRDL